MQESQRWEDRGSECPGAGETPWRLKGHVEGELRFTFQRPVGLPSPGEEPAPSVTLGGPLAWLGWEDTPHDCEPC